MNSAADIVELIVKANGQKDMKERLYFIQILLEKTDEIILQIRIAEELKLFNNKNTYAFLIEKITDISRQATGWKNTYIPQNLQPVVF